MEFVLVLTILVVSLMLHALRAPSASPAYPTIMGPAPSLQNSDPPSLDELLHLSLSTGRGTLLGLYTHGTLIQDVSAWTSLKDAPPWWAVWTNMDSAFHPPLYVQTLRLWRSLFGENDAVAIGFSWFWSLVTLVFVYLAARLAIGRAGAFWAAAILAVAPIGSYYAMEIRSYAMVAAESAVALWLMVRMTRFGLRRWDLVGFCATMLACLLTHYFTAPVCLAAGVYVMVLAGRAWWRVLLAGAATAAVYAVIWLPFAVRQLHILGQDLGYLRSQTPSPFWIPRLAVTLPYRLLAELWDWPAVYVTVPVCIAITVGVTAMAVRRPAVRPFVIWYFAIAGFLLVTDVLRQTMQLVYIRYPAAAQPAVAVFVPALASMVRPRWAVHAAGAAVCGLVLYTQPNTMHNDGPTTTIAVTTVGPRMKPDDVLILYSTIGPGQQNNFCEWMLLDFSHAPGLFPRDAVILNGPMSPELAKQLAGRRAWVLMTDVLVTPQSVFPRAKLLGSMPYQRAYDLTDPMPAFYIEFPDAPATSPATLPATASAG